MGGRTQGHLSPAMPHWMVEAATLSLSREEQVLGGSSVRRGCTRSAAPFPESAHRKLVRSPPSSPGPARKGSHRVLFETGRFLDKNISCKRPELAPCREQFRLKRTHSWESPAWRELI